jgi:hypothetical protein
VNPDGSPAVEVYFDNIILSNIRADWIITLDLVPETNSPAMYERGSARQQGRQRQPQGEAGPGRRRAPGRRARSAS